jgi:secondary thiamine-phosphate synthase enzyme
MRQASTILSVDTRGRGFVDVTSAASQWLESTGIQQGLLTLLCRHTSASLVIQENASPDVQTDLAGWLDRLAPESAIYAHDDEGPDDMPAHLKATLTGVNLQVPVIGGHMALGTWQAVYLAEHRRMPHRRQIAVHLIGE